MLTFNKRAAAGLVLAGLAMSMAATDASAATARHIYNKGHYGHAYRGHYRHYGNGAAGRAFAGAALGLIGAAAGAAIASRSYDDYPYGGPGYAYGGYGPAPYAYGGYGYGYEPY